LFIIQQHTNINNDNDEILHDVLKRQTEGDYCQCKDGIPGPKGPPGEKGEMGERGYPGRQGKRGN